MKALFVACFESSVAYFGNMKLFQFLSYEKHVKCQSLYHSL